MIVGCYALICMSCSFVTRSRTPSKENRWIGPATFAFEDYVQYYHCLPESLTELDAFLKRSMDFVDPSLYCFGETQQLQSELEGRKVHYAYMVDSCCFRGVTHDHIREQFKLYSPKYYYSHPDIAITQLAKDRLQWGEPSFYDRDGRRCLYESETEFSQLLNKVQSRYSHMLIKPWSDHPSIYHAHFLFEYHADVVNVLDVKPFSSRYILRDCYTHELSSIDIDITASKKCNEYIDDLTQAINQFCIIYNNIDRILFSASLFY